MNHADQALVADTAVSAVNTRVEVYKSYFPPLDAELLNIPIYRVAVSFRSVGRHDREFEVILLPGNVKLTDRLQVIAQKNMLDIRITVDILES